LPSEEQLRDKLGGTFRRLERSDDGWHVHLSVTGRDVDVAADVAADAYAIALLHLITGE
jgi:hypothetical protein